MAPWSAGGEWDSNSWRAGDATIPAPSPISSGWVPEALTGQIDTAKVAGPSRSEALTQQAAVRGGIGDAFDGLDQHSPVAIAGDNFLPQLRSMLSAMEEKLLQEHSRALRLQEHAFRCEATTPRTPLSAKEFAEVSMQTEGESDAPAALISAVPKTPLMRLPSRQLTRRLSTTSGSGDTLVDDSYAEVQSKSFELTKAKLVDILQRQEEWDDLTGARARFLAVQHWVLLSDQFMGIIILANTLLIGVSCDASPGWIGWLVLDIFFASIFVMEIGLKIYLSGVVDVFCGHDWKWGWFRMILASAAVFEIVLHLVVDSQESSGFNISVFRVVRLFRITRVMQVLRFQVFADLLMMIHGAMGSLRTLMWSAILIMCPVYAIALFMRETIGNSSNRSEEMAHFTTLPDSIFTVFRCIVASDCTSSTGNPIFVSISETHGWVYGVLYTISYTCMTFGLFNVIVAIYVENTLQAAKYSEVNMKRGRLEDQRLLAERSAKLVRLVWEVLRERGTVGLDSQALSPKATAQEISEMASELRISPETFRDLRKHPDFQEVLMDLDVADEDQVDLFETLDFDGSGEIDLQELILGISKLRGDARRADVVAISLMMRCMQHSMIDFEDRVISSLQAQDKRLRHLTKDIDRTPTDRGKLSSSVSGSM